MDLSDDFQVTNHGLLNILFHQKIHVFFNVLTENYGREKDQTELFGVIFAHTEQITIKQNCYIIIFLDPIKS